MQLLKCPEDETKWNVPIKIFADGRKQTLIIDFTMLCNCQCEKVGDDVSSKCKSTRERKRIQVKPLLLDSPLTRTIQPLTLLLNDVIHQTTQTSNPSRVMKVSDQKDAKMKK